MRKPDGNIFEYDPDNNSKYEKFDELFALGDTLVERIVSTGQSTPEGKWLEQDRDEWVVLLQGNAKLSFEGGNDVDLNRGDYVFISAGTKHRVEMTSSEPECLWLAFHGNFTEEGE